MAIPTNWFRYALCIDMTYAPEAIPGIRQHLNTHDTNDSLIETLDASRFSLSDFTAEKNLAEYTQWTWAKRFLFQALLAPIVLLYISAIFIPALAYRVSLKYTSIIYFPLIWTISSLAPHSHNPYLLFTRTRKSDLSRLALALSIISLIVFGSKIFIYNELIHTINLIPLQAPKAFAANLIGHIAIDKWQIASLINSSLTVVAFLFAGIALQRQGALDEWSNSFMLGVHYTIVIIKSILSPYIIVWLGFILYNTWTQLELPPISPDWIPSVFK